MQETNEEHDNSYMAAFTRFRRAIQNGDFDYLDSHAGHPAHTNGLITAASLNALPAIAYFLRHGEDINASPKKSDEGWTPLMAAAGKGAAEAVRFLLANGADPYRKDSHGEAAADIAEKKNYHIVVAVFREIGIEPSLVYLLENDYPAFEGRLRSTDVPLTDHQGRSVLPELIHKKRDELAKRLILERGGINIPGKEGLTCLHAAIQRKNPNLGRFLLENGADPNCLGDKYFEATPLMMAINLQVPTFFPLLLEFGADVNGADIYGMTPLIHAIILPSPKYVEYLLTHGADPNIGHAEPTRYEFDKGKDTWETAQIVGNKQIIRMLAAYPKRPV